MATFYTNWSFWTVFKSSPTQSTLLQSDLAVAKHV